MPSSPIRSGKDRRQVNASTAKERRGSRVDRRRCPKCQSTISQSFRRIAGGTVTTVSCSKCDWSRSSRQVDLKTLMARLTWSMPLEKSGKGYSLPFPEELVKSLKLKTGDEFILDPLTSPIGSQPMKWALKVARKRR